MKRLWAAAIAAYGRVDVAFFNAGAAHPPGRLADLTDADFDLVFNANTRAAWYCLRVFCEAMAAQNKADGGSGCVVVNSSISGGTDNGSPVALYAASKAAVDSVTRSASAEYRGTGLRIWTIK